MSKKLDLVKIVDFLNENEDLKDAFRYNKFTYDIEFRRKLHWDHDKFLTDDDLTQLKYYISTILAEEFPSAKIEEAVLLVSKDKSYHPIINYLEKLKWDGNERLDFWLNWCCGVELNKYVCAVSRKVLCGAVARAYDPGCKFDYMMILEGKQGIGKSTLLEVLGGEWYLDTHLSGPNKSDLIDVMRTVWIVEIADMAGFSKSDIQHLRSFITRKVDRVRLAYDRRARNFPRKCIMIGTHNPSGDNQYFKDDTGNRRYWPIECERIDIDKLKEIRDQLFAEAVVKWKSGEKLYIDDNECLDILENLHKKRQDQNPLDSLIEDYVINKHEVSNIDIIREAFKCDIGRISYRDMKGKQTIIGIWMKKNKWIKEGNIYRSPDVTEYE